MTTIRRIPFNALKLGVWMIHSGMIILAVGSVIYFGTKVEGDTPVFRRAVVITGPGVTNILTPMAQAYADSIPMLVVSSVMVRV